MTSSEKANAWIVGADSGISSKAIWANMMGVEPSRTWGYSHPLDPSDLGRCIRLLRLIPEWRERMPEMASRSKAWAELVDCWDALEASMESEVGVDWSKGQSAPKTYDMMRHALGKARAA